MKKMGNFNSFAKLLKGFGLKKDLLIQIVLDIYQFDLQPLIISTTKYRFYCKQTFTESNVTFSKEEYEIEIEMIKCVKKNTDQHCAKTF
jgi:hypothetical protein